MPLTFDFPLKKLKTYKGINPKPKDFDAFWNKGLAEMRAIDPKVELKKAAFEAPYADCYNMYFTGVGNARVHAKLLRPKTRLKRGPAIVQFHGYSGSAGDWFDKLAWVAAGFTVAALDCRGQGGLSDDAGGAKGWTLHGHIVRGLGDRPETMTFRHIFLDTAQLAGLVMRMPGVDPKRVGAMGGSQGGALTLVCAALEPRIKRAVPVFPFLCDYQRVWEMDQCENAYEELKDWFRRFDPNHEREKEVFSQLGYIDVQHLAPRIKAEIMMAMGLMDKICPPSTQFAAYNKIRSKKSLVLYPDFGHEGLPGLGDREFRFFQGL